MKIFVISLVLSLVGLGIFHTMGSIQRRNEKITQLYSLARQAETLEKLYSIGVPRPDTTEGISHLVKQLETGVAVNGITVQLSAMQYLPSVYTYDLKQGIPVPSKEDQELVASLHAAAEDNTQTRLIETIFYGFPITPP